MSNKQNGRTPLIIISILLLVIAVFTILAVFTNDRGAKTRTYIVENETEVGTVTGTSIVVVPLPISTPTPEPTQETEPIIVPIIVPITETTPEIHAEVLEEEEKTGYFGLRIPPFKGFGYGSFEQPYPISAEVLEKQKILGLRIPQFKGFGYGSFEQPYPIVAEIAPAGITKMVSYSVSAEVIEPIKPEPYAVSAEIIMDEPPEFNIIDVIFSDSKIYTERYLENLKVKSLSKYDGMKALNRIVNELNREYRKRGYPNAYAYIPEQEVEDGVFFVKLIEGVIGRVILENNVYTRDVYIMEHFHLIPGELLVVSDLEYQLLMFNKWSQGVAITARLQPGEEEGATDIILTAHETFPTVVSISGDNYGSEAYGNIHLAANMTMNSLTKNRDILAYGVSFSKGSFTLYADYSLLTPRHNIRMGLRGSYGQSVVANGYAEQYDIKGNSRSYSFYTTIPLLKSLNSQFTVSGSATYSYAKSTALDPPVVISEEVVTNVQGGFGHIISTDNAYIYFNLNSTVGLPFYDSASNYLKVDGNYGFRYGKLTGFYLSSKSQFQFVMNSGLFPTSLNMQVGGSSTVRGYKEHCAWGKEGLLTSLELHLGIVPNYLDMFGFLDFAYIRPEPDTGENYLVSMGVGARVTLAQHLVINVAAGFPQIALKVQDPDALGGRIHVGMSLDY